MLEIIRSARKNAPVLAVLVSFTACGEEPGSVTSASAPPVKVADAAVLECTEGQTRECPCPNEPPSKQHCYAGGWTSCGCAYPITPTNFNTNGSCLPGRYEGNFIGLYYSSYNFAGIPIPVTGVDLSGLPPLVLTLVETPGTNAGNGLTEFGGTYSVSDGYVKGTADGVFPFEGKITGSLDCASKLFTGDFEGWYALAFDLGIDLNKGYFKGPVTAVYDATSHSFKNGTWNVKEYKGNPVPGYGIVLTELGGGGDWSADYKGTNTTVTLPEAGLPRDAGAP